MKYYTVILRLDGALANAVAVEWTNQPAPAGSGQGWEPCLRRADGTWRFASHDPFAANPPHARGPGVFGDLAIRYRLSAAGPWSAASVDRKEITILEMGDDGTPLQIPPAPILAPTLAGAGKIGSEVTAGPGLWSGYPLPEFAFQWRRDGAGIPGAVARAYTPGPADDLTDLDCAVTASNASGAVVALTAALPVTYPAPTASGDLPEEIFDEDTGPQLVETAFVFTGENLSFSATGAAIDPQTGVLTVSTDAPVDGLIVTVTATNSGGAASASLQITVEAAPVEVPPPALGAAGMSFLRSVWRPEAQTGVFTPILAFPGLAGETVDAIEWSTSGLAVPLDSHWEIVTPKPGAPGEFELFMRDPAKRAPLADPKVDFAVFGATAAEITRSGRLRFRWRRTAAGLWSDASPMLAASPPPILAAIPAQAVLRGSTTTLDLAAYATGAGLAFAVSAAPASPWITMNAATGALTIAEPNNLTYPASRAVTVTVANAGGSASRTFALAIEAGAVSDADRRWRQVFYREEGIAQLAPDHPTYYPTGRLWGEGFQMANTFVREGDEVYFGGDMCGFRRATKGERWYWPDSIGLRGCVFHAIGPEPTNGDIVLVAVSARDFAPNNPSSGIPGLYRTTDGGQTFTLVQAMTRLTGRQRASIDPIACWRSPDATASNRRWRFFEFDGVNLPKFWRSNAGGVAGSWSAGGAVPAALAGATIHGLEYHPANNQWLYAWTSEGLWRTTDDGAAWAQLAPGTIGGRIDAVWIDPEATTLASTRMMLSFDGSLWWSTDGGATWPAGDRPLVGVTNDTKVANFSVGPKDSDGRRTIYVMNDRQPNRGKLCWVQHWLASGAPSKTKRSPAQLPATGGAPNGQWFHPYVKPLPAGVDQGHWSEVCGREQSKFLPSPTDVNEAAIYGYGMPWRTEDRGSTLVQSNAGYGGMNSQSMAFCNEHPDWLLMMLNDVQGIVSQNAADFFVDVGLTAAQRSTLVDRYVPNSNGQKDSGAHGVASLIIADVAGVPAGKRGRLLAAIGDYGDQQCIYRKDRTGNGWDANWTEVMSNVADLREFYVSKNNPNVVYIGTKRSVDAGDSFQEALGDRRATGCSQQDAAIVFAMSGNAVQRSTTYGNTSAGVAINGVAGAPWTTWYNGAKKAWINPFDHTRAICLSAAGDLVLVEGGGGATLKLQLDLAGEYQALGWNSMLPLAVDYSTWDETNPRRFYAHVRAFGVPNVWRGMFNANFTAITWENISRNIAKTANSRAIITHPASGDVYVSNGGGIWVLPAPGPVPSDSIWPKLPKPFPSDGGY